MTYVTLGLLIVCALTAAYFIWAIHSRIRLSDSMHASMKSDIAKLTEGYTTLRDCCKGQNEVYQSMVDCLTEFNSRMGRVEARTRVSRPQRTPRPLIELRKDNKSNSLTSVTKDNLLITPGTWRTHKDGQGFRPTAGGKSPCIPARARNDGSGQPVAKIGYMIRRLTPTECARLQTIPDWYKWCCSDTQAYKMLGNGWTVEVIKHILSHIIK